MQELATGSALWTYIIYVLFAFCVSIYLIRGTEHKVFNTLLVFWVLAQPVLTKKFTIQASGMPFDLSANRLLLLMFILVFMRLLMSGGFRSGDARHRAGFERYLFIFLLLMVFSVAVNFGQLPFKQVVAIPLEFLTFLFMYLIVSREVTAASFRVIIKAIIIMAVINALLAINQLVGYQELLATGRFQSAFGGVSRSMGLLPEENVMGSFQLVAMFLCLGFYRGKRIIYFVVPLLVISVILTFHRLDNLTMIITSLIYLKYYSVKRKSIGFFAVAALFVVSVIPAYLVFQSGGGSSELVEQRLLSSGIEGRFAQYKVAIGEMPKHPFGLASYLNEKYVALMTRYGMTISIMHPDGTHEIRPLGIHNGYLAIGVLYGIPGLIVFIIILVKMFNYFRYRVSRSEPVTLAPVFAIFIWAMVNISDPMNSFSAYSILVIGLLAGTFVGAYRKNILLMERKNESGIQLNNTGI